MTVSRDLFLAILSMDSYNRGYGVGVRRLPVSGAIGNASILTDASSELDANAVLSAGFYALAYDMTGVAGFASGERVISYRGSDYEDSRGVHR